VYSYISDKPCFVNSAVRSCATIRCLCPTSHALTGPFPFLGLASNCEDAGCTENADIRKDGHIDLQSDRIIAMWTHRLHSKHGA